MAMRLLLLPFLIKSLLIDRAGVKYPVCLGVPSRSAHPWPFFDRVWAFSAIFATSSSSEFKFKISRFSPTCLRASRGVVMAYVNDPGDGGDSSSLSAAARRRVHATIVTYSARALLRQRTRSKNGRKRPNSVQNWPGVRSTYHTWPWYIYNMRVHSDAHMTI